LIFNEQYQVLVPVVTSLSLHTKLQTPFNNHKFQQRFPKGRVDEADIAGIVQSNQANEPTTDGLISFSSLTLRNPLKTKPCSSKGLLRRAQRVWFSLGFRGVKLR